MGIHSLKTASCDWEIYLMKLCSVISCDRQYFAKGYCRKHYQQIQKHGKILERTRFDSNEFIIDGDVCWVVLYNKKCQEVARAKFNIKYYEQIRDSGLKWHLNGEYVLAFWYNENNEQQFIQLHEAIVQLSGEIIKSGYIIDHKDRDPLNCLDDNLRICKPFQNSQNKKLQNNSTSGWKGVSWQNSVQKWKAEITVNKTHIYLGLFTIAEDAARAYNCSAIKYFGEFAVLNDI